MRAWQLAIYFHGFPFDHTFQSDDCHRTMLIQMNIFEMMKKKRTQVQHLVFELRKIPFQKLTEEKRKRKHTFPHSIEINIAANKQID